MLKAFEENEFLPFMKEWKEQGEKSWQGGATTLHMVAKHMPLKHCIFSNFKLFTGGHVKNNPHFMDRLDIQYDCRPLLLASTGKRDIMGQTRLKIALKEKNWPLVEYLEEFDTEKGFALAKAYLMSCRIKPFAVQNRDACCPGKNEFELVKRCVTSRLTPEDLKTHDMNGWTIAHWLAFKGFEKRDLPEYAHPHWEIDYYYYSRKITPREIADLVQYVSNKEAPEDTELQKHTLERMPEDRKKEFIDEVVKNTQNMMHAIDRGLGILPEKVRSYRYLRINQHSAHQID